MISYEGDNQLVTNFIIEALSIDSDYFIGDIAIGKHIINFNKFILESI